MKLLNCLPIVLVVLLTGCENSGVSYMIDGDKEHSISLTREQIWVFGDEVRQYASDTTNFTEMKIYQNDTRLFVAQQGPNWWAVGTEECKVQTFKSAPADPGDLVGSFKRKDGDLVFVPVTAK
jgi:hypothetical protein